jgi:DHA1 family bicyclomycin/chloramphenicol resistance-like MFS transporter
MASLGASIYIPSIPDIARYFAVPVGDIQLTVTTYTVGFAAGTLVSGPMCDRFGRRRALLVAATLCFLGSAVSATAPGLGVLYVGRIAQAFGAATATVATRAVVRDLFDRVGTARALSLLALAATVTTILAPIIGGFLQVAFGWRAGLMMVTVIAAAVGVLLWRVLPETNVELQNEVGLIRGVVRGYVRLLRIPRFIGYGLANMNPASACLRS